MSLSKRKKARADFLLHEGSCPSTCQLVSKDSLANHCPETKVSLGSKRGEIQPTLPEFPNSPTLTEVRSLVMKSNKKLWEDPDFAAGDGALGYDNRKPRHLPNDIVWKRPWEIVRNPAFVSKGMTRFDIVQGNVLDCWFLSAITVLTFHPQLFEKVIEEGQGFGLTKHRYCGAFSFRFYVAGEWRVVTVDDRLPTHHGKLIFLRSSDRREFWPSLIEKAFAKMLGCYDATNIGTFAESSSYFGGITENFNIKGLQLDGLPPEVVRARLLEGMAKGSLCGAAIYDIGHNSDSEERYGLPIGHEYAVTGCSSRKVRVRNPWGESTEWKGQRSRPDGEFYMDWGSFMKHFHQVQVAHFSAEQRGTKSVGKVGRRKGRGKEVWSDGWSVIGAWDTQTAGGCSNYPTFYTKNPQYQVLVEKTGVNRFSLGQPRNVISYTTGNTKNYTRTRRWRSRSHKSRSNGKLAKNRQSKSAKNRSISKSVKNRSRSRSSKNRRSRSKTPSNRRGHSKSAKNRRGRSKSAKNRRGRSKSAKNGRGRSKSAKNRRGRSKSARNRMSRSKSAGKSNRRSNSPRNSRNRSQSASRRNRTKSTGKKGIRSKRSRNGTSRSNSVMRSMDRDKSVGSMFKRNGKRVSELVSSKGLVTLLVGLDQLHSQRQHSGKEMHSIGFEIYRGKEGERISEKNARKNWVADSGPYKYEKQVAGRYLVPPGLYTIIPSTFYPRSQAVFNLRVWHSEQLN